MKRLFATGLLMISTLFMSGQVNDSITQKGCGVIIAEETLDTIYDFAEVMPEFPGEGMMQFFMKNIRLTTSDQGCASTTVMVSFIVLKDGQLSNVQLAKEMKHCSQTGQDVLDVFCKMPKWDPGKIDGVPVNIRMHIPIRLN